ncbi:MAG: helix-turn-helix domain-containing protein [Butyricicoccus sp.]|nr:helix-turn-helix domain-containing protein [Butyricicoccus pullicaecorum]MDY5971813.1 helix-turn-helix domain-containing protein [Butyricicoccus sp.]
MIKYDKLFRALEAAGINTTQIRRDKIMSQNAYYGIRQGKLNLTLSTIDKLCGLLQCQPGDLVEWVPDDDGDDED